jgi:hypothetical protein
MNKDKHFKFLGAMPIDFKILDYCEINHYTLDELYKSGKYK